MKATNLHQYNHCGTKNNKNPSFPCRTKQRMNRWRFRRMGKLKLLPQIRPLKNNTNMKKKMGF